jgi:hypothetical protein
MSQRILVTFGSRRGGTAEIAVAEDAEVLARDHPQVVRLAR